MVRSRRFHGNVARRAPSLRVSLSLGLGSAGVGEGVGVPGWSGGYVAGFEGEGGVEAEIAALVVEGEDLGGGGGVGDLLYQLQGVGHELVVGDDVVGDADA